MRAARWFGESGAIERAQAVLDVALADLEPGDARAEALELAAQMAGWCNGPAAVVTLAERALEDAGDPFVRARVLLRLAAQADHVGAASALPWAVEAVGLLEGAEAEERDPDLLACALLQRASLQFATGRGDDEAAVERAAALLADEPRSTPDGDMRPEGYRAHQDRTVWAIVHDRFDAALGAYLTELDRAHARGHDRPIPIIEAEIAQLAAWSGDRVEPSATRRRRSTRPRSATTRRDAQPAWPRSRTSPCCAATSRARSEPPPRRSARTPSTIG